MAGIYIHVPFCSQACHYCDFHFSTNTAMVEEICNAIIRELSMQKEYPSGEPIETIYFGGGTPSMLTRPQLEKLLISIHTEFKVLTNAEITLEANPEDLTVEKLLVLKSLGINRLSIGIQSFHDETLKFLNRNHTAKTAIEALENSRSLDFSNINVDLIYAIPGRGKEILADDLNTLIQFSPEHVSAYSLTIEEKTVFGKWQQKGKILPINEEANATQFEQVFDFLTRNGYDHYEISNYSKPGFESVHNTNYWRQRKYLGVGPSAHSFNGLSRQYNVANNNTYLKSFANNTIPATVEMLRKEDHINEYLLTSLRTKWGCDLKYLLTNFDYDLLNAQFNEIDRFIKKNLMERNGDKLLLTQIGKMHADKLSSDLFLIN